MKKLKVLHIVGGLDLGGAETLLVNLLKESSKGEIEFHFLCFGPPRDFYFTKEIKKLGGEISFVPFPSIYRPLKHILELRNFAKNKNFDLVHIHTLLHSGIAAFSFSSLSVKIITHAHSSGDNTFNKNIVRSIYENMSKKLILKYSDKLISCSDEATNYLFSLVKNKNKDVIKFNNSIDLEKFLNIEKNNINLNINPNNINFFTLGRLEKVKNNIFAIKLIEKIKETNKNIHLYLIGDGSKKFELENYVRENKLSNYVTFLGIKSNINEILHLMDIHLMPSFFEGFPVSMLEAQGSSCRSYVSNTMDKSVDLGLDLVEFLNINDEKEWTKAILKNLEKKETLEKQVIIEAFKTGAYNIHDSYINLLKIYKEVL